MAEKLSGGPREDDLLFEARVILDVAERCAAGFIESSFVDVIFKELEFVSRHCRHSDTLPSSLRTRTEYLLLVVNSILQRGSAEDVRRMGEGCIGGLHLLALHTHDTYERSLVESHDSESDSLLGSSMVGGSSVGIVGNVGNWSPKDPDPQDPQDAHTAYTRGGPESMLDPCRTQWPDMCLTALCVAVVSMLQRVPSLWPKVGLTLAECVAGGQSDSWQMQYLSMGLVHALLLHEAQCDAFKAEGNSGNSGDSGTSNNRSNITGLAKGAVPGVGPGRARRKPQSPLDAPKDAVPLPSQSPAPSQTQTQTARRSSKPDSIPYEPKPRDVRGRGERGERGRDKARSGKLPVGLTGAGVGVGEGVGVGAGVGVVRSSSSAGLEEGPRRGLRSLRCVDDVCKSGYTRTIVWMLLHCRAAVRGVAAEILHIMLSRSVGSADSRPDARPLTDLWACCVEQGIVPKLEYICQGTVIYRGRGQGTDGVAGGRSGGAGVQGAGAGAKLCFPEQHIRHLAHRLLQCICARVHAAQGLYARLANAVVHSGNSKLRINIFSSLVFICGRAPAIGIGSRFCIASSGVSSSSSGVSVAPSLWSDNVCHEMLLAMLRDHGEFCLLLQLLEHFLQSATAHAHTPTPGMSTQTPTPTHTPPLRLERMEPLVVIDDRGRRTKMVCPPVPVVERHSPSLAAALQSALERQVAAVVGGGQLDMNVEGEEGGAQREGRLAVLLLDLEEGLYLHLSGSYNIWQEVFSHMADGSFMPPRMSTVGLIEALQITARYGMRQLGRQYSEALATRTDVSNFLQIFQASVGLYIAARGGDGGGSSGGGSGSGGASGRGGSSKIKVAVVEVEEPPYLHLHLALRCTSFLQQHLDRVVTAWRPKDGAVVGRCVHRTITCMLVPPQT